MYLSTGMHNNVTYSLEMNIYNNSLYIYIKPPSLGVFLSETQRIYSTQQFIKVTKTVTYL